MPKEKYKQFVFGEKQKEFIKLWNSKLSRKKIAKQFNISLSEVDRIKRQLKLEKKKGSRNHPYQKYLDKKIRKWYFRGISYPVIAKRLKISGESVRRRLIWMNRKRVRQDREIVLYTDFKRNLKKGWTALTLRNKIKELFESGLEPEMISQHTRINLKSVNRRLKAMKLVD